MPGACETRSALGKAHTARVLGACTWGWLCARTRGRRVRSGCSVLGGCTRVHVHSVGLHTRLHARGVFVGADLHLTTRALCSLPACAFGSCTVRSVPRAPEGCARWWGGEQCSTQKGEQSLRVAPSLDFSL